MLELDSVVGQPAGDYKKSIFVVKTLSAMSLVISNAVSFGIVQWSRSIDICNQVLNL